MNGLSSTCLNSWAIEYRCLAGDSSSLTTMIHRPLFQWTAPETGQGLMRSISMRGRSAMMLSGTGGRRTREPESSRLAWISANCMASCMESGRIGTTSRSFLMTSFMAPSIPTGVFLFQKFEVRLKLSDCIRWKVVTAPEVGREAGQPITEVGCHKQLSRLQFEHLGDAIERPWIGVLIEPPLQPGPPARIDAGRRRRLGDRQTAGLPLLFDDFSY